MLTRMPLGRFIEPDEMAEVVLFLLSDRAPTVNSGAMPIDAGFGVTCQFQLARRPVRRAVNRSSALKAS